MAIVGGGVAGCYAAWRLASSSSSPGPITIFERSDRIGGRLHSVPCAGLKDQVAELGGMRIASNQAPLLALVKLLGLETSPYPATEPDDLYYIRGIRSRAAEMRCSVASGFRPTKAMDGATPGGMFKMLLQSLTGRTTWSTQAFRKARASMTFRGKPLSEVPYEYAWREVLGSEAFDFMQQTTGYGRPNVQTLAFMEEAALSMFVKDYYHVDGGRIPGPTVHRVRGGYDLVPRRLAAEARANGVDIEFGSTLIDVRVDSDGLVRLSFDTPGSPTRTVRARRAILGLPGSAYDLLDPAGALAGDNGLTRVNRNLLPNPAVKIYSNYESQWWKAAGMTTGRSITDLPIRQCFYLPDSTKGGLVLSPYASGPESYGYWKPLLEPSAPNRLPTDGPAAEAIRSQLGELHGIEVPAAREIHYRAFEGGHVGYAWSLWAPGARYWEILPEARTPVPGVPLHCVGQATATEQGWVMNTISSVEAVLRGPFGLARPAWWPADFAAD